jgi:exopolyphosphatase/guanosine-5'-triphosphate,3'-diphosphate pyrophosphatase
MREAENNKKVVGRIKKETGVGIEIIDGLKEAEIIGATNNIPPKNKYDVSMFIDVGGGSTELIVLKKNGNKNKLLDSKSFKIGTIRILNNKVQDEEWRILKAWSKELNKRYGKIFCIGTGGNINKIVKVYGKRAEKIVTYDNLKYAYNNLNRYSLKERVEVLGLRPDRADVIVPASLIYISVMKWAKINAMYVPKIGLADGLIHLLHNEYVNEKIKF